MTAVTYGKAYVQAMTEVQTTAGIVRGTVVDGSPSFKVCRSPRRRSVRAGSRRPRHRSRGTACVMRLDYGHTAPQGDYPPPLDKLLTNFVNDGDDYLNLNVGHRSRPSVGTRVR